jgi:ligand-binding sensor domain-containing protein
MQCRYLPLSHSSICMLRKIFFILFAALSLQCSFAQWMNPINFDHFTTASGLSHNSATGILQDSAGYIWIATMNGLNRFDGSRIITYHSNGSGNSLPAEDITELTRLQNHRIAVLTSGTHIINTLTGAGQNVFVPYHNLNYKFKFNMTVTAVGDAQNNLYLVTRSGFYHFDETQKLVFRFDYYSEKEVPVTHFYFGGELLELDQDRLLLFAAGGPYVYEKRSRRFYKMRKEDCPELADEIGLKQLKRFFQPAPGQFLICKPGSDTLVYVDAHKGIKINAAMPFKPGNTLFHYRSKLFVRNDSTWFLTGHNSGFYRLHFSAASYSLKMDPEEYFPGYRCTAMLWDNKGDCWVATNKGIFHQNNSKAAVQATTLPAAVFDSLPGVHIDDVAVMGNKVYVASKAAGLFLFDKQTLKLQQSIRFGNHVKWNDVRGVAKAGESELFITGLAPPRILNTATGDWKVLAPPFWKEEEHWSPDVYKARDGSLWFSGGHVYNYDPLSGQFITIPTYDRLLEVPNIIREDNSGNIWLASHGIARYHRTKKTYDLYIDTLPFIIMPDKQVNAMTIDKYYRVWFSNVNNGLSYYDAAQRAFRHFTRRDGLPDNNIAALEIVGNWLWIASYSGLACINLETFEILSFGKEDGFPDEPIMKGAKFFYDKAARKLYIGFSKSVVRFDPDLLLYHKPPPKVFIESLAISRGQMVFLPGSSVSTCWKENDLSITIGSINFRDAGVQQFAYRILGEPDSSWINLERQPNFSISNMAPGSYTIQVKVFARDNRWPPQITRLMVEVSPPLWQENWFLALACVLLIGAVYLFFRWRIALVARREKVKTQIEKLKAHDYKNQVELEIKQRELVGINEQLAEARLNALQSQMNPHFVFNALNSIKLMILEGQNKKASRYLSKFASMIRMTLEHSRETFTTIDKNIAYLSTYLEMEQLRFDEFFIYSISVDEEVDVMDVCVPSLMIQPLVENAIWHGLLPSGKEKKISIKFELNNGELVCMVEDNGIGINAARRLQMVQRPLHQSVSLENLRRRIRIMNEKFNTNCGLEILDLSEAGYHESGTRAVLKLKCRTSHQNQ